MKQILPLVLLALIPNLSSAQSSYPWNPDFDADGVIGVNDLLAVLAVFESEFEAQLAFTDSSSAILHTGSMDFWDCSATCAELDGNWKVLDDRLAGRYKDEIGDLTDGESLWLDIGRFPPSPNSSALHFNTLRTSDWNVFRKTAHENHHCVCQTRVLVPIDLSPTPCNGYIDLCGVCNGPGPIYDCGCQPQPEWACDCEGNQLDALGVCGGNCLGDFDGDGICDSFPPGPCGGATSITYHDTDYEIIEYGGNCWFAEDLRTTKYANGDSITSLPSNSNWINAGSNFEPGFRFLTAYQNVAYRYNWYAVNDERNLCPNGWHVPSRQDFVDLVDSLSSNFESTGAYLVDDVYASLMDNENWDGTNLIGYSALPNNIINSGGSESGIIDIHQSWSSTAWVEDEAWYFRLSETTSNLNGITGTSTRFERSYGLSVRCIKEN